MTVVHCKRDPFDVYIGRPSKWGNPHPVGRCYGCGLDHTREDAIRLYEAHVRASPHLMAALPTLRGKVLGCWCSPRACHGDVLVRLAGER